MGNQIGRGRRISNFRIQISNCGRFEFESQKTRKGGGGIQNPGSKIQHPESSIQHPARDTGKRIPETGKGRDGSKGCRPTRGSRSPRLEPASTSLSEGFVARELPGYLTAFAIDF